jgi:hypothetical protein
MGRTRIPKRASELKLKGKRLGDNSEKDGLARYWKTSREEKVGKKSKGKTGEGEK